MLPGLSLSRLTAAFDCPVTFPAVKTSRVSCRKQSNIDSFGTAT